MAVLAEEPIHSKGTIMSRFAGLSCVSILGLFLVAGIARAQQAAPADGAQGPARPGGPASILFLLNSEKVQTELALTAEQKEKIKTLAAELRPGAGDRGRRDAAQIAEQRAKMEAAQKKLLDVLNAQQRERFQQIRVQVEVVAALLDPEIAQALGLTKEQLKEIEAARRPGERNARGSQLTPEERREQFKQNRKEAQEKALKVLTPEQREKLEKMKGEKFEIDLLDLMPQRGRRG
jgi:Spy/CpxP family protein refolding chaperone